MLGLSPGSQRRASALDRGSLASVVLQREQLLVGEFLRLRELASDGHPMLSSPSGGKRGSGLIFRKAGGPG